MQVKIIAKSPYEKLANFELSSTYQVDELAAILMEKSGGNLYLTPIRSASGEILSPRPHSDHRTLGELGQTELTIGYHPLFKGQNIKQYYRFEVKENGKTQYQDEMLQADTDIETLKYIISANRKIPAENISISFKSSDLSEEKFPTFSPQFMDFDGIDLPLVVSINPMVKKEGWEVIEVVGDEKLFTAIDMNLSISALIAAKKEELPILKDINLNFIDSYGRVLSESYDPTLPLKNCKNLSRFLGKLDLSLKGYRPKPLTPIPLEIIAPPAMPDDFVTVKAIPSAPRLDDFVTVEAIASAPPIMDLFKAELAEEDTSFLDDFRYIHVLISQTEHYEKAIYLLKSMTLEEVHFKSEDGNNILHTLVISNDIDMCEAVLGCLVEKFKREQILDQFLDLFKQVNLEGASPLALAHSNIKISGLMEKTYSRVYDMLNPIIADSSVTMTDKRLKYIDHLIQILDKLPEPKVSKWKLSSVFSKSNDEKLRDGLLYLIKLIRDDKVSNLEDFKSVIDKTTGSLKKCLSEERLVEHLKIIYQTWQHDEVLLDTSKPVKQELTETFSSTGPK